MQFCRAGQSVGHGSGQWAGQLFRAVPPSARPVWQAAEPSRTLERRRSWRQVHVGEGKAKAKEKEEEKEKRKEAGDKEREKEREPKKEEKRGIPCQSYIKAEHGTGDGGESNEDIYRCAKQRVQLQLQSQLQPLQHSQQRSVNMLSGFSSSARRRMRRRAVANFFARKEILGLLWPAPAPPIVVPRDQMLLRRKYVSPIIARPIDELWPSRPPSDMAHIKLDANAYSFVEVDSDSLLFSLEEEDIAESSLIERDCGTTENIFETEDDSMRSLIVAAQHSAYKLRQRESNAVRNIQRFWRKCKTKLSSWNSKVMVSISSVDSKCTDGIASDLGLRADIPAPGSHQGAITNDMLYEWMCEHVAKIKSLPPELKGPYLGQQVLLLEERYEITEEQYSMLHKVAEKYAPRQEFGRDFPFMCSSCGALYKNKVSLCCICAGEDVFDAVHQSRRYNKTNTFMDGYECVKCGKNVSTVTTVRCTCEVFEPRVGSCSGLANSPPSVEEVLAADIEALSRSPETFRCDACSFYYEHEFAFCRMCGCRELVANDVSEKEECEGDEEDELSDDGVYKTQLCNFHQRGHCKKGNRCRHAHGDHELRSFPDAPVLPFDMNAVESPDETGDVHSLPSQKIDHPVSEDLVMPAAESSQVLSLEQILALAMQSKDTTSGLRSNEGTPPHSNLSRNHWQQTTPEKVVPMFPGIQRNHSSMTCAPPAVPQCSPQVAEPMDLSFKVDRLPSSAGLISSQIALAARMAKAAELELQAAQIKAQQQIQYAAEIAAGAAQCNSLLGGRTAIDDAIMQTLHQRIPLRDIAPMNIDTAAPVLPPGLACQVAPPGLGASRQISPKDFLFRHTADMSNQRNTAWVI